jgi:hypothetical protein|tara:strand:+ start:714 stop:848 length:135 start_codon:yes stop_codon:yes gene_type:complete
MKEAEIKAMKVKYPGLFKNGMQEDKINAMVSKGNPDDDNSDVDD